MKEYAKILDCTLRDGAYLIDKTFGKENIFGIINGLVEAKVDFIEVGFFQNEGFGEGKTVFLNSAEAAKYIPNDKNGCRFTVLADCSRYNVDNLDMCSANSVDAVRECFFKQELEQAFENCYKIKEKGYLLFIQPVDILGYSDSELLELVKKANEVEPFCFSIVDTFGSMYQEDLHRIFELLHYNLIPTIRLGFHSHNNMQLSNALSQDFLRMARGKRQIIIDGTLSGMGRGAGNTPTELIAQYMISKMQAGYNLDALLDIIDNHINNLRTRCSWGYNTPYFVAGCYGAHVNNITFLMEKNSIRSRDIRYILNKMDSDMRKRYDYTVLEKIYIDYLNSDIDDEAAIEKLGSDINDNIVLMLVPGKTIKSYENEICNFIENKNPIVIAVNFIPDNIKIDFMYLSNQNRFLYWRKKKEFGHINKIITSNLPIMEEDTVIKVSFIKLVKCGWEYMDNSSLMLLHLLDRVTPAAIYIGGFDGYDQIGSNYYSANFEMREPQKNATEINTEIMKMLEDYILNRKNQNTLIDFVTPSRFQAALVVK